MSISAFNARNQIRGTVKDIHAGAVVYGDVVYEVELETAVGTVTSVITSRSLRELGLARGQEVVAIVKATEVDLVNP
ncbi:MAG: TOBE domain-containing protein [Methylococcales bacterium]